MRTTLTLDPDVARLLDEEVHRLRKPLKQVVNDALRRGLSPESSRRASKPYRVTPHRAELQPGFDRAGFNRLATELEDEAVVAKHTRQRA
jgi:hypothetical protein